MDQGFECTRCVCIHKYEEGTGKARFSGEVTRQLNQVAT